MKPHNTEEMLGKLLRLAEDALKCSDIGIRAFNVSNLDEHTHVTNELFKQLNKGAVKIEPYKFVTSPKLMLKVEYKGFRAITTTEKSEFRSLLSDHDTISDEDLAFIKNTKNELDSLWQSGLLDVGLVYKSVFMNMNLFEMFIDRGFTVSERCIVDSSWPYRLDIKVEDTSFNTIVTKDTLEQVRKEFGQYEIQSR